MGEIWITPQLFLREKHKIPSCTF